MLISMGMDTGIAAKSCGDDDFRQEITRVERNLVAAGLQEAAAEMAGRNIQRYAMPISMAEMDVGAFLREMAAARR